MLLTGTHIISYTSHLPSNFRVRVQLLQTNNKDSYVPKTLDNLSVLPSCEFDYWNMRNVLNDYQENCFCFPYDPYFAIPVSCSVLGLLFFHIAAFGCKTFIVTDQRYNSERVQLGYWSTYDNSINGCMRYPNDRNGSIWKFGRFIGFFGSLLIWIIFAAVVTSSCFKYPKPKLCFTIISTCMGIVSLFSFLLLVGLSNDNRYSLSAGGILAIVSAVIWACGAISMFFCMNERVRVPTRATTPTRSNILTNPLPPVESPEIDNTENVVIPEIDNTENVVNLSECPVDTQVERINDLNGNETVITTRTFSLPDGTRKVIKTIESIEYND